MTALVGAMDSKTPYVLARILRNGRLCLEAVQASSKATRLRVCVDTGFTGGFSLPETLLARLELDFLGYEPYILANRQRVEVPTFAGFVIVGRMSFEARFIPGQPLMGVEFMEAAFRTLRIDFRAGALVLR